MAKPTLGDGVPVDIARLCETRLLVQANSGGGKSWALRRLIEQVADHVPFFVLDPEGEFRTLREKIDCVIAAPKDGDVLANPQTAQLLARRLLELKLSAVIDIYEMPMHDRVLFVRRFCEALVNAPKNLWRPTLVVLDEAHVFAPQVGSAESRQAVMDLATRGRKRGFALCAATQRLSKLHKDVAAELLNKLIGRTGLDVDVKRANDELGFNTTDKQHRLRNLIPGEFYAFGPAFDQRIGTLGVMSVKIGKVTTTHPKAGHSRALEAPAPSRRLAAVLGKELADLPKQAQEEYASVVVLKKQVSEQKQEIARLMREGPKARPVIDEARVRAMTDKAVKLVERDYEVRLRQADSIIRTYHQSMASVVKLVRAFDTTQLPSFLLPKRKDTRDMQWTAKEMQEIVDQSFGVKRKPIPITAQEIAMRHGPTRADARREATVNGEVALRRGALSILSELVARQPAGYTRSQVATLVGMASRGGTFLTYISDLRRTGCIEERDGLVYATPAGVERIGGEIPSPKTHEEVMSTWSKALRKGALNMLEHVVSCNAHGVTRDSLAEFVGMAPRGGTYLTYLSDLRRNGLIEEKNGTIHAAPILFPEGL